MNRLRQIGMRRRWGLAFVAVLGFAVAQVSLAAHQFAHDGETAETCASCLQLDQFESGVAVVSKQPVAHPQETFAPSIGQSASAADPLLAYASRAPPTH